MFKDTRYIRNSYFISDNIQSQLAHCPVCIVGFGGLGQRVSELLVRLGIKDLLLIDYDKFDESNLNRQLFSYENNINEQKTMVGKKELLKIDSEASIRIIDKKIEDVAHSDDLSNIECIIDCLDNTISRLVLADIAESLNLPLVHGAINGWEGRVGTFKGDFSLYRSMFQGSNNNVSDELSEPIPSLAPVVSYCASLQASETLKLLLDQTEANTTSIYKYNPIGKIIEFNLADNTHEIIDLFN